MAVGCLDARHHNKPGAFYGVPGQSLKIELMAATVATFRGVSKSYSIYTNPALRLVEIATLQRRSFHTEFWALSGVTFDIQRGEAFCIVGENGSGKSTLLQILAGVLSPSAGDVQVAGRVAALLELGAGFHPEFTGRDNVYLAAAIHGFTPAEIDARFAAIEAFAEIGAFMDQAVKTYSSGMLVRLAFAVAIHVEPEILVIDEALAVGDFYFRQRCLRKVNELRARGVTIVLVSHSMGDVNALADRVLWLDHGRVRQVGAPGEVIEAYSAAMAAKEVAHKAPSGEAMPSSKAPEMGLLNVDHRSGAGGAEILGLGLFDDTGDALHWLNPRSRATVRIRVAARRDLAAVVVGFTMRNHLGVEFAAACTHDEGMELGPLRAGEALTVDFQWSLPALYPSHFSFSPYVAEDGRMLDAVDNALTLQMAPSDGVVYGYITVPCRIEVNRDVNREPALA
jgi:lipopolysaccharide transport system ATP-binding protein